MEPLTNVWCECLTFRLRHDDAHIRLGLVRVVVGPGVGQVRATLEEARFYWVFVRFTSDGMSDRN
jgi:hypothetical protein